jgi:hypothetical protein
MSVCTYAHGDALCPIASKCQKRFSKEVVFLVLAEEGKRMDIPLQIFLLAVFRQYRLAAGS